MWQEFAGTLNELNKTYQELIALGKKKRSALVAIDMKTLEGLLPAEKTLTERVEMLEKKRQKALIHLAVTNRSIKKDSKLEDLLPLAPAVLRQVLIQLNAALTKSATEASELSEGNQLLIRSAMKAINYHLNRIGGASVEPAYGSTGGEIVTHRKNFDFNA